MPATTSKRLRVGVVIPAYNSAAFIGEAIESVLNQTRPVDEIVVVDDGSTDETAAVVARYATAGVCYIRQNNQGPAVARNHGIQETTSELIAFLDSDDIWLPNKIAQQVAYLEQHPDVALVSGAWWWWNVTKNTRRLEHFGVGSGRDFAREMLVRNVVGNPSMVVLRRSVLEQVGLFNPALRWADDWDMWIRIALRAKVGVIKEPVIIYRSHPSGLSHDRQWEQFGRLLEIPLQHIRTYRPIWWRPILAARAWSSNHHLRALYAIEHGFPRRRQMWHACQALLAYPFERTKAKLVLVGRIIVGETLYQCIRAQPLLAKLLSTKAPMRS